MPGHAWAHLAAAFAAWRGGTRPLRAPVPPRDHSSCGWAGARGEAGGCARPAEGRARMRASWRAAARRHGLRWCQWTRRRSRRPRRCTRASAGCRRCCRRRQWRARGRSRRRHSLRCCRCCCRCWCTGRRGACTGWPALPHCTRMCLFMNKHGGGRRDRPLGERAARPSPAACGICVRVRSKHRRGWRAAGTQADACSRTGVRPDRDRYRLQEPNARRRADACPAQACLRLAGAHSPQRICMTIWGVKASSLPAPQGARCACGSTNGARQRRTESGV